MSLPPICFRLSRFGFLLLTACGSGQPGPTAGPPTTTTQQGTTQRPAHLFQTGLVDAFLAGMLDGNYRVGDLHQHGDFGLGAFNNFDGELLLLDGKLYQVKADGHAYAAADSLRTPFSVVNFFRPDTTFSLRRRLPQAQLFAYLDSAVRGTNKLLAIKLTGRFRYVKARSNPPVYQRPYPPVAALIGGQKIFEHRQVQGTFVGYRLPAYLQGINVPGYHFHFLTADHQAGGHVLDFTTDSVTVAVDELPSFSVELPTHPDFQRLNLAKNRQAELNKVESR